MILDSVAVVVMAKHPTPGRVKTRLMAALTARQAADVHQLFLTHLLTRLATMRPAELVVCFDPPHAAQEMRQLPGLPTNLTFVPQCPGDLGHRLADAAGHIGARHERLLFFGVDSPDVPPNHIAHAAELTRRHQVSISPTDDGGYWSLGLGRQVNAAALLEGIAWSSGREAEQTLRRARDMGYDTARGERWDDIDRPEDLQRLVQRLQAAATAPEPSRPAGQAPPAQALLRQLQDLLKPPSR